MKRFIYVFIAIVSMITSAGSASAAPYKIPRTIVINEKKLTREMLETRKEKHIQIIEYALSTAKNSSYGYTPGGQYISYRNTACTPGSVKRGDIVLSYFVYNPYTDYIDDIIERWDYIVYTRHKPKNK